MERLIRPIVKIVLVVAAIATFGALPVLLAKCGIYTYNRIF